MSIPSPLDTDAEDVAWALQTADALWKRNERVDAIVWLRRAAQAAGELEDDDRALALARNAAELSEWIAQNPGAPPSVQPGSLENLYSPGSNAPGSLAPVDDLMNDGAPAIPPAAPSFASAQFDIPVSVGELPEVPSAAQVHAGILDPWSGKDDDEPDTGVTSVSGSVSGSMRAARFAAPDDEVLETRTMQRPPDFTAPSASFEPEEVVTTSMDVPRMPTAHVAPVVNEPSSPPPLPPIPEPTLVSHVPQVSHSSTPQAPSPLQGASQGPPPLPRRPPPVPGTKLPPPMLPSRAKKQQPPIILEAAPPAIILEAAPPTAPSPIAPPPEQTMPALPPSDDDDTAAPSPVSAAPPVLDLENVEGLSDLPDEARDAFAAAAEIHHLRANDEAGSFALALVVEGMVDVAATIVDAAGARVGPGTVLRTRGTVGEGLPLRLICVGESATIATWRQDAIDGAFKSCPWVEEDLRVAADRTQALVGITMGPLAERLDASLRQQVTDRLVVRVLGPREVLVEAGQVVPGLMLVGVGGIEMLDGATFRGQIGPGEFLFASTILGGGSAPLTARASEEGAVILWADRKVAQELLVTCPPLLELFAGM